MVFVLDSKFILSVGIEFMAATTTHRRDMPIIPVRVPEMNHEGNRKEYIDGKLENFKITSLKSSEESRHYEVGVAQRTTTR